MDKQSLPSDGKKYLFVAGFLIVLAVAGGIYMIIRPLATSVPSSTITPVAQPSIAEPTATSSAINKMDELQIEDEVVGTGAEAVAGKSVTVNYIGTLTDGTKFDSSYDRGTPFTFNLGAGEVIQGWDQGVMGMKVGGKRKLTIPPSLGYGDAGVTGAIPGGATLIFEVELLKVE